MRIEDLQIGDIVFDGEKNPVHFYGMGSEGRMGSTDRYCTLRNRDMEYEQHFTTLSPVPLTKEIMELNGFVYSNYYYHYSFFVDEKVNYLDTGEEPVPLWLYGGKIKIMYVHELQHILRLMGLYEMAENIKTNG